MDHESPFRFVRAANGRWRSLVADVNLWGEAGVKPRGARQRRAPGHFGSTPLDSGAGRQDLSRVKRSRGNVLHRLISGSSTWRESTEVFVVGAGQLGSSARWSWPGGASACRSSTRTGGPALPGYALALTRRRSGCSTASGSCQRCSSGPTARGNHRPVRRIDPAGRDPPRRPDRRAGFCRGDAAEMPWSNCLKRRSKSWESACSGIMSFPAWRPTPIARSPPSISWKKTPSATRQPAEWTVTKTFEWDVRHVIAADGHRSRVRRSLGIAYPEVGQSQQYAVFEFKTDATCRPKCG